MYSINVDSRSFKINDPIHTIHAQLSFGGTPSKDFSAYVFVTICFLELKSLKFRKYFSSNHLMLF